MAVTVVLVLAAVPYAWVRVRYADAVRRSYQMLDAGADRLRSSVDDRIKSFYRLTSSNRFDSDHFQIGEQPQRVFRLARERIATADFDADSRSLQFHYFGESTKTRQIASADGRGPRLWEDYRASANVVGDIEHALRFMPLFDQVIVTDSKGTVLYEGEDSDLQLKPRLQLRLEQGEAVAQPVTRRLRGDDYLVFQRGVSLGSVAKPVDLTLTGIVRSKLFQRRVFFQYRGMIYIISALALVMLSMPIILATTRSDLDPRDRRERRYRRALMLFAVPWLTMLIAALAVSEWYYQRAQSHYDSLLVELADRIERALSRDLSDVETFVTKLKPTAEGSRPAKGSPAVAADWRECPEKQECSLEDSIKVAPIDAALHLDSALRRRLLPNRIQQLAIIDGSGEQVRKWAQPGSLTPLIQVGDRAYFKHALLGNSSYFGSVASWTTGDKEAILSTTAAPAPAVLAATFRPPSLFDTAMPFGVRFALVDDAGKVLFHSDESRNLHESLLRALAGSRQLADAIDGESDVPVFSANYDGRNYRFLARPFGAGGVKIPTSISWPGKALVVFYDQELLATVQLEALWLAMFSSAAVLVLVESMCWAILAWLRRRWRQPVGKAETRRQRIEKRLRIGAVQLSDALSAIVSWHGGATAKPTALQAWIVLRAVAGAAAVIALVAGMWTASINRADWRRFDSLVACKTLKTLDNPRSSGSGELYFEVALDKQRAQEACSERAEAATGAGRSGGIAERLLRPLSRSVPTFDRTINGDLRRIPLALEAGGSSLFPSAPSRIVDSWGPALRWSLLVAGGALLLIVLMIWRLGVAVEKWGSAVSVAALVLPLVLVIAGWQLVDYGRVSLVGSLLITLFANPSTAKLLMDLLKGVSPAK